MNNFFQEPEPEPEDFPDEEENEEDEEENNGPEFLTNPATGEITGTVARNNFFTVPNDIPRINFMRPNSRMPELLNTFGIEFEVERIFPRTLPLDLQKYFREDHDASVESPVYSSRRISTDLNVYFNEETEDSAGRQIIGTEYVSNILNIGEPDDLDSIKKLCEFCFEKGEPEEGNRSGIHFHISMAINSLITQKLTSLSGFSEQIFYYVGGMGYKFRGIENDFTYCRSLFNPAICHNSGNPFYCFDFNNVVKGANQNTRLFFDGFGYNPENPPRKYHPARYSWLTFYNLLTSKNTVELRVLNKSLNPNYIISALKLFQKFLSAGFKEKLPDLPFNSIYDPHSKEKVLNDFYYLAELIELDDKTSATIEKIITRTPDIKAERKLVYTHLREGNYSNPNFNFFSPVFVERNKVKSPNYIDSHVLGV